MTTLVLRSVATGAELDRVELRNGVLHYQTGVARSTFEGRRAAKPGTVLTDTDLFAQLAGWSNGYLQLAAA